MRSERGEQGGRRQGEGRRPVWALEEWGEVEMLAQILETRASDRLSLDWLELRALHGPWLMSSVLSDDLRWADGSVAALLDRSGEGKWWHDRDRDPDSERASRGADPRPLAPGGSGRRALERSGLDLSIGFGSHQRSGDVAQRDYRSDPPAGAPRGERRRGGRLDGEPCACRLTRDLTPTELELVRLVARSRALLALRRSAAWRGAGAGPGVPSLLVEAGPQRRAVLLARGSWGDRSPRWRAAVAFPAALREAGTGRLLTSPHCGLCGAAAGRELARWVSSHPLTGVAAERGS